MQKQKKYLYRQVYLFYNLPLSSYLRSSYVLFFQKRQQMLINIEDSQKAWAVRDGDMKLIYAGESFTRVYDDWYEPERVHR